jgi:hypothetical protein
MEAEVSDMDMGTLLLEMEIERGGIWDRKEE